MKNVIVGMIIFVAERVPAHEWNLAAKNVCI